MKVSTGQLARRYATAFFESALDAKTIEKLSKEAEALLGVLSPELEQFFASPTRSSSDKEQLTQVLIDKFSLSEQTARGLNLMGQNNRLHHLRLVFKKILALIDQHKNVVRAQVRAASPLSDDDIAGLEEALSRSTGSTVVIECETEPQLRAGMVIKVGTRQIDSSLKTRMSNLKEFLSQGV